jgi:hypothetical protein
MGAQTYCVSRIEEALELLSSSDAGELQQQAKQLFKQQLHAGLATRLQTNFKQTDVTSILQSLDVTLADKGLLSQFTHTVHCGGVYAARAALESCLESIQQAGDACRTDLWKVITHYETSVVEVVALSSLQLKWRVSHLYPLTYEQPT